MKSMSFRRTATQKDPGFQRLRTSVKPAVQLVLRPVRWRDLRANLIFTFQCFFPLFEVVQCEYFSMRLAIGFFLLYFGRIFRVCLDFSFSG
jgi:hypothetical protein